MNLEIQQIMECNTCQDTGSIVVGIDHENDEIYTEMCPNPECKTHETQEGEDAAKQNFIAQQN